MSLRDLADFYTDTYDVTIRGKVYRIESPDIDTGRLCVRLVDIITALNNGEDVSEQDRAAISLSDADEDELYPRIVGAGNWEAMRADGVSYAQARHVVITAMYWVAVGEAAADAWWESVAAPKALPKQPEDRKTSTKTRGTRAARPVSDGSKPSNPPGPAEMETGETSSETGESSKPT